MYIYDKRGLEVHCLREHEAPLALEFLPRFFMLASVGEAGALRYQDTSTGEIVAQHRTRLGRCEVLRGSPTSGVLLAGHGNGTVTLWSPNMGTPLASLLSHRGAVRSLAVDVTGRYLVTGGQDCQVRVWDVRTFRPLHAYFSAQPASALDVSQRGMLAVGYGPHVQVWAGALGEKAKSPYLNHLVAGGGCAVAAARFCPYDDVLGVGHAAGFASLLVRARARARWGCRRQLGRPAARDLRRRAKARNVTLGATRTGRTPAAAGTDRGGQELAALRTFLPHSCPRAHPRA